MNECRCAIKSNPMKRFKCSDIMRINIDLSKIAEKKLRVKVNREAE